MLAVVVVDSYLPIEVRTCAERLCIAALWLELWETCAVIIDCVPLKAMPDSIFRSVMLLIIRPLNDVSTSTELQTAPHHHRQPRGDRRVLPRPLLHRQAMPDAELTALHGRLGADRRCAAPPPCVDEGPHRHAQEACSSSAGTTPLVVLVPRIAPARLLPLPQRSPRSPSSPSSPRRRAPRFVLPTRLLSSSRRSSMVHALQRSSHALSLKQRRGARALRPPRQAPRSYQRRPGGSPPREPGRLRCQTVHVTGPHHTGTPPYDV